MDRNRMKSENARPADTAVEEAAVRARLRLAIFRQLERRAAAPDTDGPEFRRLVQSFKDMCTLSPQAAPEDAPADDPLSTSLWQLAKELEHDAE